MSETIETQTTENTEPQIEQLAEPKVEAQTELKKDAYHELPDWARKRMGELAAQKNAERERAAQLQAQIEALSAQNTQQSFQPQSQEDVYSVAAKIAEQKLQEQTFIQKMGQIEATAKEQFGAEYDKAISNLSLAGVQSNDFLKALAEIPNPEKVLVYLGRSDNVADAIRIANLSPLQMGIEMTKLSSKASKEFSKQRSNAPAPVGEVSGGSSGSNSGGAEPPMSDTQAWIAWRNKTKRSR
jgi:hypothetical protein